MDLVYRRQRHIYNLTRKYYLLGRDRLVRQLRLSPGDSVVEIGCGTARNLIRIARTYPGARLYGLDASQEMLRTAEEAVRRAGIGARVTLAHGLAEEMTPALFGLEGKFDHTIFSYSLSMIPDWPAALRAAAVQTRPDGAVHIVDFGDFSGLPTPLARALRSWLRRFHVQSRANLLKLLERTQGNADCALHILPGRYAFVLTCTPADILELTSRTVAD